MRCLIMYYSVTHTTECVAKNIAQGLRQEHIETDLVNILCTAPPDLSGYDMIGFGTPVYGFRIPLLVENCIRRLPPLNNKSVFAFMLRGSYMFDAPLYLKRALAKKGAQVSGWFFTMSAGYFLGYMNRGCMTSPDRPNTDDFDRARRFGIDMARRADADKWPIITSKPPLIYRIEQISFGPMGIRLGYRRIHKFEKDKCKKCRKCMVCCPAGNISADLEGFPCIGNSCITCRHCQSICPTNALAINEWFIDRVLLDYNVRKVMADSAILKAPVKLHGGKIERLDVSHTIK